MGSNPASFFKPPAGLSPNEQVVWSRQNKSGIPVIAPVLFLLFFGGIPLALGVVYGAILPAGIFFAFVALITLPFIAISRRAHGTSYYLTTSRLVRTDHNAISQQISRSIFKGRPLSAFLQKQEAYTTGHDPTEKYSLKVLDPSSGNVIMNLGIMIPPAIQSLESLIGNVYCQYCGRQNDPSSATCSSCGANL
ncbi:MAG TPA: zinc ribbon domain-containing protein [Candidatus Bathyarchaeia archaeon]|nr:zinc ribbon domain-containing protein [Candidatus Bathyarchaeia archaeon]